MKIHLPLLFIAALLAASPGAAFAQDQAPVAQVFELLLRDGSRLFGTVTAETEQEVSFRTSTGTVITVRRTDVASLRPVKGRVANGEFLHSDEHRSRLFFAPTGRSLAKGQVSLGVYEFLAPFVQVGVTDRFSIGGGTPLLFGIDEDHRPFWVTPKFQIYRGDRVQAAIGVLHVTSWEGSGGGIAYGVSTFGGPDNAVTAGAGLAYSVDGDRGGVVMVGGERRVRRNLKLITENYLWSSGHGIVSGGVRLIGERLSADLALAMPLGVDEVFAFPVVNFVYVF